jgi:Holliday junction resolvase
MAQTPEAKVKATVVKILKQYGAYYFFPATGGFGRSGVPDIVGCYRGLMFGIECKAGKNKPTALQLRELAAISEAGARALVVNEDNIDAVAQMLENIRGKT